MSAQSSVSSVQPSQNKMDKYFIIVNFCYLFLLNDPLTSLSGLLLFSNEIIALGAPIGL